MPMGARTSFLPNTDMLTKISAGEQVDALGGGDFGFGDMYEMLARLRNQKEMARRDAIRWQDSRDLNDEQRMETKARLANPAGPRSLAGRPTPGIGGSGTSALMQNKDLLNSMRQDFYGQRIGSNPRFADLVPAQEMTTQQPFSARGWDQYAALAGAGNTGAMQEAGANLRQRRDMSRR